MLKLEWKVQGYVLHYTKHISVFEEGPHKLGFQEAVFLYLFLIVKIKVFFGEQKHHSMISVDHHRDTRLKDFQSFTMTCISQ